MLFSLVTLVHCEFNPSIYDPKAENDLPTLSLNKGFIANHNSTMGLKGFGQFSIISLNTNSNSDLDEDKQVTKIIELVDTHHPTFLSLQSLSHEQMVQIKEALSGHYNIMGEQRYNNNVEDRKLEYNPVFYDTNTVNYSREFEIVEKTTPQHTYASWNVFQLKNTPRFFLNFINADLYSADASFIETQLYNIMKHFKESSYSGFPLFMTGQINEKTETVKTLIANTLKNTLDADTNNADLAKTTFHNKETFSDGIQRDFILAADKNGMVKVNYARILSKYDTTVFSHYPVMAIFTVKVEALNEVVRTAPRVAPAA